MSDLRYRPGPAQSSRYSWAAAWPVYLLVAFAALRFAELLPSGLGRALVTVPVLLMVPGVLTLGVLRIGRSLDPAAFGGLAAVLSAVWLAFAALLLNALQVRITAASVYVSLLIMCAVLTVMKQWHLTRRAAVREVGFSAQGSADVLSGNKETDSPMLWGARYAFAGVAIGVILLGGGAYAYTHVQHPAPTGYTWLAWAGVQHTGVISVGPSGLALPFQIEHEQPGATEYKLTAGWTGSGGEHALIAPRTVHLGAERTIREDLTLPAPPGACAYRVVVTLTKLNSAHPESWSINADVQDSDSVGAQADCAS